MVLRDCRRRVPGQAGVLSAAALAVAVFVTVLAAAPFTSIGATLVLRGGQVVQAAEAADVGGGPGDQRAPAAAHGSGGYLAIWETCDDCPVMGADLAVRALDSEGTPLGPVTVIEDSPLDARSPALAYNPDEDEFLAVWSVRYPGVPDRYGVRARRLGRDGRPITDTVRVAEVVGVWPAAVVSSVGAWHGYDIAWAAPGPQPQLETTVIHTRHLDAAGVPAAEVWQLSDPGFEALRPRSLRTSGSSGALAAWFAYQPGQSDEPRLRGVRLGLSGRPIGRATDLAAGAVCDAALADHAERPELLLVTVGCDGRLPEPSGTLTLARLNRSGVTIGEPLVVTDTVVARDLAVVAASGGDYLLVRPEHGAIDPISQTMALQRFGAGLSVEGPQEPLGVGEGPALAANDRNGGLVLAARWRGDWDVVAYRVAPRHVATPTSTAGSGATATVSPGPGVTTTTTPSTGSPTPTPSGTETAVPTVPTGTASTTVSILLPLALRGQ